MLSALNELLYLLLSLIDKSPNTLIEQLVVADTVLGPRIHPIKPVTSFYEVAVPVTYKCFYLLLLPIDTGLSFPELPRLDKSLPILFRHYSFLYRSTQRQPILLLYQQWGKKRTIKINVRISSAEVLRLTTN